LIGIQFLNSDNYIHYIKCSIPVAIGHFTSEEIAKYERRFEEGFNITSDERYNAWLIASGKG